MKLTELDPRWCIGGYWINEHGTQCHIDINAEVSGRDGMGMTFDCPKHRDHRLGIYFKNPTDGLPPKADEKHLWQRTGDSFETLTLKPSINAKGCWHGFITNGEIL